MTNWMTAAGLALIAGGLATLISFRAVLFGGGKRRAARRQLRALEAPRRRPALSAVAEPVPAVAAADDESAAPGRRGRKGRRRALVTTSGGSMPVRSDEDDRGGLASIGLADEEIVPGEFLPAEIVPAEIVPAELMPAEIAPVAEQSVGEVVVRRGRGRRARRRENAERAAAQFDEAFPAEAVELAGQHPVEPVGQHPVEPVGQHPVEPVGQHPVEPLGQYLVEPLGQYPVEPLLEEMPDDLGPETYADTCAEADAAADGEEAVEREPVRADRYGDRVQGWVRPEYHEPANEPRPGEYWTPIPVDLAGDAEPSAKGYGWPSPVERLPAVPDYEPATGFDLIPIVSEPTEVVPAWPVNDDRPGRIRLPRSWSVRNEKPPVGKPFAGKPPVDRAEPPPTERRRPRPRPRPRPEPQVDRTTTVYVSRHAADPPPKPARD